MPLQKELNSLVHESQLYETKRLKKWKATIGSGMKIVYIRRKTPFIIRNFSIRCRFQLDFNNKIYNFKIEKSNLLNKLNCQQNWSTIEDGPQLRDHLLQLVYIDNFPSWLSIERSTKIVMSSSIILPLGNVAWL